MNRKAIFVVISLITLTILSTYYYLFITTNTPEDLSEFNISIRHTTTVEEFMQNDNLPIKSKSSLAIACKLKRLKTIKPGRYRLEAAMDNNSIINHIRSGGIPVVQLRIDNAVDIYELAGKLGQSLLHDSTSFIDTMLDPALLVELHTDTSSLACIIIPNTYEFYWTMTPRSFIERMLKESQRIWNSERKAAANQQGITEQEVVILASIVKAETADPTEAPRIAGLYLNRMKIGMPLQSDPTATFGQKNKKQRVYLTDLQSENPYNTYKISGLPPGPINFPELVYLDAVLHPEKNNYLYMCAQPGGTGRHNFCSSFAEHEKNRQNYIQWLQARGIR